RVAGTFDEPQPIGGAQCLAVTVGQAVAQCDGPTHAHSNASPTTITHGQAAHAAAIRDAIALTAGRAVRVLPFRGFRKAITQTNQPDRDRGRSRRADPNSPMVRLPDHEHTSSPRQPHWRNELLNIKKKALGIGMSAGLIASLLATAVAPSVFASTAVVSAGVVPVGGTSATAASFQFCENTAGAWSAGG